MMSCAFEVETVLPITGRACDLRTVFIDGPDTRACVERTWLEVFAEILARPPAIFPCDRIARLLCTTFRSDACAFSCATDDAVAGGVVRLTDRGIASPTESAPGLASDVGAVALAQWGDSLAATCPDRLSLPTRLSPASTVAFVVGRDGAFHAAERFLAETLSAILVALATQIGIEEQTPLSSAESISLTSREMAVLALLGEGLTAVAIARRLKISARTVHKHLERIYTKLNVADRLSATLAARRLGLIKQ